MTVDYMLSIHAKVCAHTCTMWLLALLLLLDARNQGIDGAPTLTAMDNANFSLLFPLWLNPQNLTGTPETKASVIDKVQHRSPFPSK